MRRTSGAMVSAACMDTRLTAWPPSTAVLAAVEFGHLAPRQATGGFYRGQEPNARQCVAPAVRRCEKITFFARQQAAGKQGASKLAHSKPAPCSAVACYRLDLAKVASPSSSHSRAAGTGLAVHRGPAPISPDATIWRQDFACERAATRDRKHLSVEVGFH